MQQPEYLFYDYMMSDYHRTEKFNWLWDTHTHAIHLQGNKMEPFNRTIETTRIFSFICEMFLFFLFCFSLSEKQTKQHMCDSRHANKKLLTVNAYMIYWFSLVFMHITWNLWLIYTMLEPCKQQRLCSMTKLAHANLHIQVSTETEKLSSSYFWVHRIRPKVSSSRTPTPSTHADCFVNWIALIGFNIYELDMAWPR